MPRNGYASLAPPPPNTSPFATPRNRLPEPAPKAWPAVPRAADPGASSGTRALSNARQGGDRRDRRCLHAARGPAIRVAGLVTEGAASRSDVGLRPIGGFSRLPQLYQRGKPRAGVAESQIRCSIQPTALPTCGSHRQMRSCRTSRGSSGSLHEMSATDTPEGSMVRVQGRDQNALGGLLRSTKCDGKGSAVRAARQLPERRHRGKHPRLVCSPDAVGGRGRSA